MSASILKSHIFHTIAFMICSFIYCNCTSAYPEVAIVNKTNEFILLKDISFNGCIWNTVIGFEEATSPKRCLPGEDRIHFKRFNVQSYCQEQAEDQTIDGICLCDGNSDVDADTDGNDMNEGLINREPNWFNYQTLSLKKVNYGEFHLYELTLEDMEQDFSVAGPYGH